MVIDKLRYGFLGFLFVIPSISGVLIAFLAAFKCELDNVTGQVIYLIYLFSWGLFCIILMTTQMPFRKKLFVCLIALGGMIGQMVISWIYIGIVVIISYRGFYGVQ